MTVRKLEEGDVPGVVAMLGEAGRGDPDYAPLDAEGFRRRYLAGGKGDTDGGIVAVEGGAVVGWARAEFHAGVPGSKEARGSIALEVLPEACDGPAPRELYASLASRLSALGAVKVDTMVERRCARKRAVLESLGLRPNGYETHVMVRMVGSPPEAMPAPSGVAVSRLSPPRDVPLMLDIHNAAFSTRGPGYLMSLEQFGKLAYIATPRGPVGAFCAREAVTGRPVGMAINHIDPQKPGRGGAPAAWTFGLSVVPEARRRGVGRALMARSLEWMGEEGAAEAWLRVNVANADAVRLYGGMGYEPAVMRLGYSARLG